MSRHRLGVAALLALLSGCTGSLSPLSHKLELGQEPYFVFVADGEGGEGDLFASPGAAGQLFQVTFTRLDERLPRLSPDGSLLAFVRSPSRSDSARSEIWVMNLINGAERRVADAGAINPTALAWAHDSRAVYAGSAIGVFVVAAPPAASAIHSAEGAERLQADSSLLVLVGDPPVGAVTQCAGGSGLCIRHSDGAEDLLDRGARWPAVWAPDSLAYEVGGEFVVRPLGGGTTRLLRWTRPVSHARELSYFAPR